MLYPVVLACHILLQMCFVFHHEPAIRYEKDVCESLLPDLKAFGQAHVIEEGFPGHYEFKSICTEELPTPTPMNGA